MPGNRSCPRILWSGSGSCVLYSVLSSIVKTSLGKRRTSRFTELIFVWPHFWDFGSRCCSCSVWICGLYYGALHVLKSCRALWPCVSTFILALWSHRLGKRELVYVLLVHWFVCFARVRFCSFFSSPWCLGFLGLAAVCDCGPPCAFLLTFIHPILSALTICAWWCLLLENVSFFP